MKTETLLKVKGKEIPVSNLGKVLYPQTGFTKGDVVQYYVDISPVLLPHLKARALTMKRYPDGVEKFFFYEKQCPSHRPDWVKTATVYSKRRKSDMCYCLINDLPSLVWTSNLADLELHTSLARSTAQDRPTMMVFDLDPGEGADILNCAQVALWLRDKLEALSLETCIKTSGSKGLQLYVPLNTPVTFDTTKTAALRLAEAIEHEHSDSVVTNMKKELRRKKVLIDWSQNDEHKTTVCVYSLRATKEPGVSTPLEWREVERALQRGDRGLLKFAPHEVLTRVRQHGDLFAPVLKLKQKLPR